MNPWQEKNKILVICPRGVTEYLNEEIRALDFPVLRQLEAAVQTEGTLEDTMLLNLHLQTAQRVLYQLRSFKVITPGELYAKINAIDWENIIYDSGYRAYVTVTSFVDNKHVTDSRFVNLKVKDAIVDRIRDKLSKRPDSGPDKDKAVVHVYWKNDQAIIYLDTSGERLSLRGYRKIPLQAPLQETLAAALIMATGWHSNTALINPMCGSGTLAIEAALMALGRAPGLLRDNFGFMYIRGFSDNTWQTLRKNARSATKKKLPGKIIATDIDQKAVDAARQNARTAGLEHLIEFHTCSFENTPLPKGPGIIILNPPYGARMEAKKMRLPAAGKTMSVNGKQIIVRKAPQHSPKSDNLNSRASLESTYEEIGHYFKNIGRTGGWRGYVFTGNLEMIKSVGLRTKRRLIFFNGDIECRLLEYELYTGSKKQGKKSLLS